MEGGIEDSFVQKSSLEMKSRIHENIETHKPFSIWLKLKSIQKWRRKQKKNINTDRPKDKKKNKTHFLKKKIFNEILSTITSESDFLPMR